ncbi:hypothetical protein WANG_1502 [Lactobacillus kefiranofaciens subsp. kefiranofaciens]|nr:hypothetical protein WANG_1502 [Lactobacillus kefiranofaciens subsp. kefiranofaciens]
MIKLQLIKGGFFIRYPVSAKELNIHGANPVIVAGIAAMLAVILMH